MVAQSTILVTGSAGRIGQAVVQELLARGQTVRGLDLVPTPGVADSVVGDILSAETVQTAMVGVAALVHLAAIPDDDDFLTRLLPTNIVGVYNVLEAARQAGVRRVVLGSSGQVVWYQRMREQYPIGVNVQPTPRAWYAATKCFLEAAGIALAEGHGRTVIAVRLGWCPRTPEHARELEATPWGPDVYLSPGDAGRFFAAAALAAVPQGYHVLNAASRPRATTVFDMEPTRALLGFEPQDVWPHGSEPLLSRK
ncbi:MAG: NAD(P)-dependent oxidoreductase [Gemmataceae bacterium]